MKVATLLLCAALVAQAAAAGQRKLLQGELLGATGADAAALAAAAASAKSSSAASAGAAGSKPTKHCKGAVFEACCTLPITFASHSTKVTAPLSCTVEETEDDKHASIHKPWTVVIGSGPEASLAAAASKTATKPSAAGTAASKAGAAGAGASSAAGASADAGAGAAGAAGAAGKGKGKTYELELADPSVPLTWVGEVDGEEFSCICFNPIDELAVSKWAEITPKDLGLGGLAGKELPSLGKDGAASGLSLGADAAAKLVEAAAGPGDK